MDQVHKLDVWVGKYIRCISYVRHVTLCRVSGYVYRLYLLLMCVSWLHGLGACIKCVVGALHMLGASPMLVSVWLVA